MVIARTPYRISFFGGGTDYPAWYRQHGGAVLSTSINKYCYVSCRSLPPFFSNRHRIVWSHIENVSAVSEILHPAVRGFLQAINHSEAQGLEIHHQGDLPARSGIGSSSSFMVGLVQSMATLYGYAPTPEGMAKAAIEVEQNFLQESVGSQDQIAVAYGGLNVVRFERDDSFSVTPLKIGPDRLESLQDHLLLFYAGTGRLSSEYAKQIIASFGEREAQLKEMHRLVGEAAEILEGDGDLDAFGSLLDRTWKLKRQLGSQTSNTTIDEIYEKARSAGALGGKLLGAGSTGFLVFYVPPRKRDAVVQALGNLLEVPFRFDAGGSRIVHSSFDDEGSLAFSRLTCEFLSRFFPVP